MKYDIITIGGATEDITFYTHEGVLIDNKKDILRQKLLAFEYGAKIKVDRAHSSFGGGAANTAVSFSRMGFKVASLVAVGRDERGKRIINNFKRQGVDTRLVQKVKNIETGFSFLLVGPNNEHIVFSNRAANIQLSITNYQLRIIKNTKWIYITSLSGKWEEVLKKIFSAKRAGVAWNPGHVQLAGGLKKIGRYLKKTIVLFLNKDEAIELVMSDPKFKNKGSKYLDKVKNLLIALESKGPKIIVVTNGKHGADAYDPKYFKRKKAG